MATAKPTTTIKVATQTGAAKDDIFAAASTGLSEDKASGSLNVLVNDPGAAKLHSLFQGDVALASLSQMPVLTRAVLSNGAVISMNADGTVGYDASGIAGLQSLALGQSYTDNFQYTVRMANGATSTAKVSVQLSGANDAPVLASIARAGVADSAAVDAGAAMSGALAGSDVDNGAVLTYSLLAASAANPSFASFALDGASGVYRLHVGADGLNALAAGEVASASYDVQVRDEHGAVSAVRSLVVDLVGANDAPVLAAVARASVADTSAADAAVSVAGALAATDVDHGATIRYSFADGSQSITNAYGTVTLDAQTGSYVFDVSATALNDLAGGQAVALDFSVIATDEHGLASNGGTIGFDLVGADEAAPPPAPVNLVTTFMVNHGQTDINGRQSITGFDSNDMLKWAQNYTRGATTQVDTNGDGVADSSAVAFDFVNNGGKLSHVEVVLVGYLGVVG
jgi:VCBS repeat-containing protein